MPPSPADTPWYAQRWGLPALWKVTTGAGIRVAVLDGAVADLASLSGRVLHYNPDGQPAQSAPFAQQHGTFCGSLVASADPRTPGMAPGATVLSFHILGGDDAPDVALVEEALEIGCIAASAQVVSCSFTLEKMTSGIRNALQALSAHGIIVIGAAGDDDAIAAEFPESVPSIISVTGQMAAGDVCPGMRLGTFVDIGAPGDRLRVFEPTGSRTVWTGLASGATALCAGVAALALGVAKTHEQLESLGHLVEGLMKATGSPIATEHSFKSLEPAALVAAVQRHLEVA